MPAKDKWDQFVESSSSANKWEQFAEPGGDELTRKTQAAAPQTSTKPFFEKPPMGTPFPSTNPIEKAGQRLDLLGQRESFAERSPTPVTDVASVLYPAAELGGAIAEQGIKAVAKRAVRPAIKAAATSSAGAGIGAAVGGKRGAEIGAGVGLAASPFVPDKALADVPIARRLLFSDEELADIDAARKGIRIKAEEKAGLRRPQEDLEAERAAKKHEAMMNKEAAEHDAIRKRYETEKAAQVKAEQAEAAHREKLDAAHAKSLREIETARQKGLAATEKLRTLHAQDIERRGAQQGVLDQAHADRLAAAEKEVNDAHADTERLRTMHASDLMKRGSEQRALDMEAKRLAGETEKATSKANATKQELGKRLARLNELRVARAEAEAAAGGPSSVSPEVWKELSPMDKARIVARYENTKALARERGMVHAARGATGPQLSNDAMRTQVGLPPPPEP